jgi:predicted metal-dependent hydrolase
MRDDKWLFEKLDEVWDEYFPDVTQENDVRIVWGRKARTRLGSIKAGERRIGKHPETIITINSLFKDVNIPEYVVVATIAHELSHYTHGFHSPLERKYQNPHAGGVVHKEMKDRGLEKILKAQKKWLKENWREYISARMKPTRRRRRRVVIKWI